MLQIFSELERLVKKDLILENQFSPQQKFKAILIEKGICTDLPVESFSEHYAMRLYYEYALPVEFDKIDKYINEKSDDANSEKQLKKFIEAAFIKLCKLKSLVDNESTRLFMLKGSTILTADKFENVNTVLGHETRYLTNLINKVLSDYNHLLLKDVILKYHPDYKHTRELANEKKQNDISRLEDYYKSIDEKVNNAKSVEEAVSFLFEEIKKCKNVLLRLQLDEAEQLISSNWYCEKCVAYLNAQVEILKQKKEYLLISENESNKAGQMPGASISPQDLKPTSILEDSNLQDYVFPDKIEDFKKIESEMLQREFLNEKGHWHHKKEKKILVALIYILQKLDYLKPKLKRKKKEPTLLPHRRFFQNRYRINISQEMQPSRFKPDDFKRYTNFYRFIIPGIETLNTGAV